MAAEEHTAIVAGGGIAGMAAAVTLEQAGWRVMVLERAPAFGEVGAGLALTVNGMAAGQRRQGLHAVLHQAAAAAPGVDLVTGAEVSAVQPGQPGGDRAEVTWRRAGQTQGA